MLLPAADSDSGRQRLSTDSTEQKWQYVKEQLFNYITSDVALEEQVVSSDESWGVLAVAEGEVGSQLEDVLMEGSPVGLRIGIARAAEVPSLLQEFAGAQRIRLPGVFVFTHAARNSTFVRATRPFGDAPGEAHLLTGDELRNALNEALLRNSWRIGGGSRGSGRYMKIKASDAAAKSEL